MVSVRLRLVLGSVLFVVLATTGWATAEWRHLGGTPHGTNAGPGAGAISGAADELPGVSWRVDVPPADFAAELFYDTDGDGQPEVITRFRGGLAAFDLLDGSIHWTSPGRSSTTLVGLADVDGDGVAGEIVAVGQGMGGGVQVVDGATGSSLWSFSGMEFGSGVMSHELRLADLDADGADELIFSANMAGSTELLVADLSRAGGAQVVSSDLEGSYLVLDRSAAGDFDGDGLPGDIAVFQGTDVDLHRVCDPADAGAVCSEDGTLCLCHVELVSDLFTFWAFPAPPRAVDADGDGDDELLTVHSFNNYSHGVGVLDPGPVFAGSGPVGGWLYDYPDDPSLDTVPRSPSGTTDLDGDGAPEVLVSIFNPLENELGLDRLPADDGLNHPGGFVTALFAADDGALLASLPDTYAHGVLDLDGDGVDEVVVETTSGWTFSGGHVQGWELVCAPDCTFELAWERTDSRITRTPARYDDVSFPPQGLEVLGEPLTHLLAWSGDYLHRFVHDGADSLTTQGGRFVAEDHTLAGVHPESGFVIVSTGTGLIVHDGELDPIATVDESPSEEAAGWLAVPAQIGDARAVPIVAGRVFLSNLEPSSYADADAELFEHAALAQDVDGDTFNDVFSWDLDPVTADLRVARHEFDGAGGIDEVWTWIADSDELDGYRPRNNWPFAAADYDDDGVDDLILVPQRGSSAFVTVLDGETGEPLWSAADCCEGLSAPILPIDVLGPGGYGDPDGLLDVFRATRPYLDAWEFGDVGHANRQPVAAGSHRNAVFVDLDGDGSLDVVTANIASTATPGVEAWSLLPELELLWGSVDLPLAPPDTEQALAVAEIDDAAGPDLLFASADSAVGAMSGLDGSPVDGFPLYLSGGGEVAEAPRDRAPLTALIVADLDGDGLVEALAGSREGWLYGLDVVSGEAAIGLQWSFYVGAPVTQLATGDVDGDGALEVLVSTRDGQARVLDGLGLSVILIAPGPDDCVESSTVEVSGSAVGVEEVQVLVQGVPAADPIVPATDGTWAVDVELPLVEGLISIVAQGLVGGAEAVADVVAVTSRADLDEDGVTACGGDCDDDEAAAFPGNPEVCDGIDNDCDPATDEAVDGDGDGVSLCDGDCDDSSAANGPDNAEDCEDTVDNDCDEAVDADDPDCAEDVTPEPTATPTPTPEPTPEPDGEGCNCGTGTPGCGQGGTGGGSLAWLALAGLALRRRRR